MVELRGMTAVVAVDRATMGDAVRDCLVGCNMKVPMLAETIDRALILCEKHNPNILVVSFIFDKKPALELMNAIRRNPGGIGRLNPKIPIIVAALNPQPKQVKACIHAGAHEFLGLPTSRDGVMRVVQRALKENRKWIQIKSYSGPDRRRQDVEELPFEDRRKPVAAKPEAAA